MPHSILIVDDEPGIRQSLAGVFEDEGFDVAAVESGEQALREFEQRLYTCVLLDVWLPGIDGLETLERLKTAYPDISVVMISGHGNIETAVKATKLGAFDFVEKPLSLDKTVLVVKNAIKQRELEVANTEMRAKLERDFMMVGNSVPMRALRQQISYAAPTTGRVLIYGESGTGKELVARALHARSLRASQSFVEMNCAAIPEELIESELFGHIKGAFTGATQAKRGKFEQADDATLFLDEIGDMSMKTQSKVLRALEEQRFQPVGSESTITVDVRVIAATNKRLEAEIEKGAFRADLFYRLNVIPFEIPPLRERLEDIPLLVEHFNREFSLANKREMKDFTPAAIDRMQSYHWPGNVRELQNYIERSVVMAPGDELTLDLLPETMQGTGVGVRTPRFKGTDLETLTFELVQQGLTTSPPGETNLHSKIVDRVEKELIVQVLASCDSVQIKAAARLGINRNTLHKKLKDYGLEEDGKD